MPKYSAKLNGDIAVALEPPHSTPDEIPMKNNPVINDIIMMYLYLISLMDILSTVGIKV